MFRIVRELSQRVLADARRRLRQLKTSVDVLERDIRDLMAGR